MRQFGANGRAALEVFAQHFDSVLARALFIFSLPHVLLSGRRDAVAPVGVEGRARDVEVLDARALRIVETDDGVQAGDANHVAALLVEGVGRVDAFERLLQLLSYLPARQLDGEDLRVGRDDLPEVAHGYVAGRDGRAVAPTVRKGYVGPRMFEVGVRDEIVHRRFEHGHAVERGRGLSDDLCHPLAQRRELFVNDPLNLRIRLDGFGDLYQPVPEIADAPILDFKVDAAEERAVETRLDEDCLADDGGRGEAVVRVPAQQHVDVLRLFDEPDLLRKAEVRDDDDEVNFFLAPQLCDAAWQGVRAVGKAQARAEVFRHRLRDDGRGDADEAQAHAARLADDRGRELPLPGLRALHVAGDDRKVHLPDALAQHFGAVGELPVAGRHHVEPQRVQCGHDRRALGPDRRARPVNRVAAVGEDARPSGLRPDLPDERGGARVATSAAIFGPAVTPEMLPMQLHVRVRVVLLNQR